MTWERFKAVDKVETVVIAGEVFKIRKSLKAKECCNPIFIVFTIIVSLSRTFTVYPLTPSPDMRDWKQGRTHPNRRATPSASAGSIDDPPTLIP